MPLYGPPALPLTGGTTTGFISAPSYRVNGVTVLGTQKASVADPTGGSVIDVECRAQLTALISRIESHGLIVTV